GVRVCGAPGDQTNPRLVLDHPHAILTWDDARNGDTDLYAMDISESGAAMPGWPADGRAIVANPGADHIAAMFRIYDLSASQSHIVLLWSNTGRVLTHVLEEDGNLIVGPYWPTTGLLLSDSTSAASAPVAIEHVVYSDPRYLVAWVEDHDGVPEI